MARGIIRTKIGRAFSEYKQDQNLQKFVFALCDVADYNIHYAWQREHLNSVLMEEFRALGDEVITVESPAEEKLLKAVRDFKIWYMTLGNLNPDAFIALKEIIPNSLINRLAEAEKEMADGRIQQG